MIFFRILVIFVLCSCGRHAGSAKVRIGVDASWEELNFGPQTAYVNGFTDELLREIARLEGVEFEKVPVNGGSLFSGLKEKKYDAVLTSLPPYTFNLGKYDFSQNFLDLGPVFIVPVGAKYKKLAQVEGRVIGVLSGDSTGFVLEGYSNIRVRGYRSIPDLLNAAVEGDVVGVLLPRILAVNYVADLYAGTLKIASAPLNGEGLHLIAEKGAQKGVVQKFDRGMKVLKKKKRLKTLLKKWSL